MTGSGWSGYGCAALIGQDLSCVNDERRLGRGHYRHGTTTSPHGCDSCLCKCLMPGKTGTSLTSTRSGMKSCSSTLAASPDTSSDLLSTSKVTSSWFPFLGDCGHLPSHLCLCRAGLFCPCSLIPPCGSPAPSTSSGRDGGCGCMCIHTKSEGQRDRNCHHFHAF